MSLKLSGEFGPHLLDVFAEGDGILPDVGEAAEVVADGAALFGNDPKLVAGARAFKP